MVRLQSINSQIQAAIVRVLADGANVSILQVTILNIRSIPTNQRVFRGVT